MGLSLDVLSLFSSFMMSPGVDAYGPHQRVASLTPMLKTLQLFYAASCSRIWIVVETVRNRSLSSSPFRHYALAYGLVLDCTAVADWNPPCAAILHTSVAAQGTPLQHTLRLLFTHAKCSPDTLRKTRGVSS